MKFKKLVAVLVSLVTFASVAACGGSKSKDMFADYNPMAKQYAEYSVALNNAVKNNYWVEEAKFAYHYYPNIDDADGKRDTAFAWPYTEMVASNWRIATLSSGAKASVNDFYRSTLDGFEYYRSLNKNYHCYVASRATEIGMAGGDTYYDDNIWISREFLNAFQQLGDEKYLATSLAVAEYVYSGWANDELGGIYWCEQKKNSRNTCSNAPAALLFGRLYEQTKDEKWLERAKQVYAWNYKNLRDPSDNVYWDNISNDGHITTWKFTYNTGSMIGAAVQLYKLTNQDAYLQQAKLSALGAYNYWFKDKVGVDYKVITSDNPWFNVLLLDAWVELYPYDAEGTLPYIQAYEANLNHAYQIRDEASGFMPSNWVDGFSKDADSKPIVKGLNILDMAANAENMGTLAIFYQNVKL